MPSVANAASVSASKSHPIPLTAMPLVAPSALLQAQLSSNPSLRISGRQLTQPRPIDLNIGSLTHSHGSSVVKIGETTIICGVRGEILPVSEIPSYNASDIAREANSTGGRTGNTRHTQDHYDPLALYHLVVPNIDLSTGCSPAHALNTAPLASTQSLTQRLYSLLLSTRLLSASDLEIKYSPPPETNYGLDPDDPAYVTDADVEQVKAYWVLYVDMVCISHGGHGVAFDAAWLALLAALHDTLLPRAWWDGDEGIVLCDSDVSHGKKLKIDAMPVPLSFGVFEGISTTKTAGQSWTLIDMDAFEEECCHERGCVVIDGARDGEIVRIEKNGGGALGVDGISDLMTVTRDRGKEWINVLDAALKSART